MFEAQKHSPLNEQSDISIEPELLATQLQKLELSDSGRQQWQEKLPEFSKTHQIYLDRLLSAAPDSADFLDLPGFAMGVSLIKKRAKALGLTDTTIYPISHYRGKYCLANTYQSGTKIEMNPIYGLSEDKKPALNRLLRLGTIEGHRLIPLLAKFEQKFVRLFANHEHEFIPYREFLPLFLENQSGDYDLESLEANVRMRFGTLNRKLQENGIKNISFHRKRGKAFVALR